MHLTVSGSISFITVSPDPILEIPANAKSGYRHTRSTLQAGFSSDNYHSVEQWGAPIRPMENGDIPIVHSRCLTESGAAAPQVVGGGLGIFPGGFPLGPQPVPNMNGNNMVPGGQGRWLIRGCNHRWGCPFSELGHKMFKRQCRMTIIRKRRCCRIQIIIRSETG